MRDEEKKVLKKKQLSAELSKKIEDERAEIRRKQGESEVVQSLSRDLEKEWIDVNSLTQTNDSLERKLLSLQELLGRKRDALYEIGKIKKEKSGLELLEHLYQTEHDKNRWMAKEMQEVQRKLDMEIAERNQLIRENSLDL